MSRKKSTEAEEEKQDKEMENNKEIQENEALSEVQCEEASKQEEPSSEADEEENDELCKMRKQLEAKAKQCEEYFSMLQRMAAEFDNYRKRTAKEKQDIYADAVCEVVGAVLPVADNLERAIQASQKGDNGSSLREGIEMVLRQFNEVLKSLGVEVIKGVGEKFDPNLHEAVMHVDDDSYDENVVVEEFQKGYIYKEKVIRHSMVKVAN